MTEDEAVSQIQWPAHASVEALAQEVARLSGFQQVTLHTLDMDTRDAAITGLTVARNGVAEIYVNPEIPPLNRRLTLLHEYAHVLYGDLTPAEECSTVHRAFATLDDPVEQRAESLGMRLLTELRHREQSTELLQFIGGGFTA